LVEVECFFVSPIKVSIPSTGVYRRGLIWVVVVF